MADRIGAEGSFEQPAAAGPAHGPPLLPGAEPIRDDSRPVRWIDATTGTTVKAFDAVAEGYGTGVKGDTKTVDTTPLSSGGYRPAVEVTSASRRPAR